MYLVPLEMRICEIMRRATRLFIFITIIFKLVFLFLILNLIISFAFYSASTYFCLEPEGMNSWSVVQIPISTGIFCSKQNINLIIVKTVISASSLSMVGTTTGDVQVDLQEIYLPECK